MGEVIPVISTEIENNKPVISTKIENNKCPWEVTSLYSFHYFCCPDQGNLLRGIQNLPGKLRQ